MNRAPILFYRIVPSIRPWIATEDAPKSHDAAFDNAVLADGLIAIFAAGRMKAAHGISKKMRHPPVVRGQSFLISADQSLDDLSRDVENSAEHDPWLNG